MTREDQRGITRRQALAGLAWVLAAPAAGQMGFDPLDLWRQFRDRKLATRNTSKPVRLVDGTSGRGAVLRLVSGGGPGVVLTVLIGRGRPLHPHTVIVRNQNGETFARDPLPPEQTRGDDGEWAVVPLEDRHLDLLCATDEATIIVRGWDESIESPIDLKQMRKLRTFRDRLRSTAP